MFKIFLDFVRNNQNMNRKSGSYIIIPIILTCLYYPHTYMYLFFVYPNMFIRDFWIFIFTFSSNNTNNILLFNWFRRSSIGTFIRPMSSEGTSSTTKLKDTKPQPKLDYRSMVSVDDKPGLFVSVDSKYIFII